MATVIEMKGDHQEFKEEVETTDMALFVRTSDEAMYGLGSPENCRCPHS